MDIFIYALIDPRTGRPFYVGKTNNIKVRLKSHRTGRGNTRCAFYIRGIRSEGLRPEIKILETCSDLEWEEKEREWISKMNQKYDIVNCSDGGQPGRFISHSLLTKERLRRKFIGRPIPQEQREQISKSLTGIKQSSETISKRFETMSLNRIAKGLPPIGANHERYVTIRRERRHAAGAFVRGSEEWKHNASEKQKAYYASLSEEEKQAFRNKRKGKTAWNKNKLLGPLSEEQRNKLSTIHRDRLAILTTEQRKARMQAAIAVRKAKLGY